MHRIFISYSSKEYDIALKFRTAFQEQGLPCWMAPESIPIGSNYAVEIPKAIQEAQVFVLILSDNSQNSIWVRKEIDLAVNLNKLIFTIKTGNYQLVSPFSFYLTDVQMMQASEDPDIIAEKLKLMLEPSQDMNEVLNGTSPVQQRASVQQAVQSANTPAKKLRFTKMAGIIAAICAAVAVGGMVGCIALFSGGNNKPDISAEGISEKNNDIAATSNESDDIANEKTQESIAEGGVGMDGNFTFVISAMEFTGTYNGDMTSSRIPEGEGDFYGQNEKGDVFHYKGNWNNGITEGSGCYTLTYSSGERRSYEYTGELKGNMNDGYGEAKIVYASGDEAEYSYKGQWKEGTTHGTGTVEYIYTNGDVKVYEGEIANGKWDGNGIYMYTYANPAEGSEKTYKYEGKFKNGLEHGAGTETYTYETGNFEARVYEGYYVNGKLNGEGKYTIVFVPDNELNIYSFVYEGNFQDGIINGHGKYNYVYTGGNLTDYQYEGEFSNSNCNGYGEAIFHYANGDMYTYRGQWVDGKKSGSGKSVITYADGTQKISEGQFENDEFVG